MCRRPCLGGFGRVQSCSRDLLCVLQLWNRKVDTKCLMAWNDNLVVLSFRGTASMRNVLADIKVRAGGKSLSACQPVPHDA